MLHTFIFLLTSEGLEFLIHLLSAGIALYKCYYYFFCKFWTTINNWFSTYVADSIHLICKLLIGWLFVQEFSLEVSALESTYFWELARDVLGIKIFEEERFLCLEVDDDRVLTFPNESPLSMKKLTYAEYWGIQTRVHC